MFCLNSLLAKPNGAKDKGDFQEDPREEKHGEGK
jgi:hypothetical protein